MRPLTLLAAFLLILLAACQPDERAETPPGQAAVDTQRLEDDIQAELREVDQEISELESRVENAPADVRQDLQDDLEQIRSERDDIAELSEEVQTVESQQGLAELRGEFWQEKREIDMMMTEARLEAATERGAFERAMQDEIDELDREIQELEQRSADAEAQARQQHEQELSELREQRRWLEERQTRLGEAGEQAWQDVRREAVEGWDSFTESLRNIRLPEVDVDVQDRESSAAGS